MVSCERGNRFGRGAAGVIAGAVWGFLGFLAPLAAEPATVVTIKPLHSLAAGVMAGVGEPILLVKKAMSPHGYTERPSDAVALNQAQILIWVGGNLETQLRKRVPMLGDRTTIVSALETPGMVLWRARRGTRWLVPDDHGDADEDHEADSADVHSDIDHHLWLDTENARAFVNAVVDRMRRSDPDNAEIYTRNGRNLDRRLVALDRQIENWLRRVRNEPYLVFHDAYQYFERRYGLHPVGSVTLHPDDTPTALRLVEIFRLVRNSDAKCVFSEPQFKSKMVRTLVSDTGVGHGTLDPIGADLAPGPELYFTLMHNLAASLASCLEQKDAR